MMGVALGLILVAPALAPGPHMGSHHGSLGSLHGGAHPGVGNMPTATVPAAVGAIPLLGNYWLPYYYMTIGPFGPVTTLPPVWAIGPGAFAPPFGIAGPAPPRVLVEPPAGEAKAVRKTDPARAEQLQTFGDRMFRVGNTRRAADRYEQALRADPGAASVRVRLAQVALVRGRYAEAAGQYRDALVAEPGWLARAGDIQSIYAEPADFARQLARLESHLQSDPNDRDAWFVLGAQLFLSGRPKKAADIFLRLTDRRDPTLEAFLDAASPERR
jgi:tetratricopeptide (TPR) repeat protein